MSQYQTLELISYVLGDAPPSLADEIARELETDTELSAKLELLRGSVSVPDAAGGPPNREAKHSSSAKPLVARRWPRWRIATAACVGFVLLTSLSWGAWE